MRFKLLEMREIDSKNLRYVVKDTSLSPKTIDMNGPITHVLCSLYGAMSHATGKDTARRLLRPL